MGAFPPLSLEEVTIPYVHAFGRCACFFVVGFMAAMDTRPVMASGKRVATRTLTVVLVGRSLLFEHYG